MIQLSIYTTLGCHLCAQLESLLVTMANQEVSLHRIEISDDDALVKRYGVRIPVLMDGNGEELDRGFDIERLSAWLQARGWLDEASLAALTTPPESAPPIGAHQRSGRRYLG
ncbi:glutaredoxin family protein [Halomonas alkaliantarctica]|uniref:glutaredoxin family protein n=1 Tax=Halomonas alkaliantarctica TaxID=232346 RepID=UPI0004AAD4ED|nr:glutaredoxin family protein [Halomonas alkaliantarctica]